LRKKAERYSTCSPNVFRLRRPGRTRKLFDTRSLRGLHYSPYTLFDQAMLGEQTTRLLAVLKERGAFVITLVSNWGHASSAQAYGRQHGASPETVRHIEKRALQRLHAEASKATSIKRIRTGCLGSIRAAPQPDCPSDFLPRLLNSGPKKNAKREQPFDCPRQAAVLMAFSRFSHRFS
jgi:hypothetical protein